MIEYRPDYYDRFTCLAGACPDSCCREWSVQVDPQAARFYQTLPGPLGDDLRGSLVQEEGETVFRLRDGRCPMLRPDGLCRLQTALGEEALCRTCREFPRLTHDYGDFRELDLELSCPAAAELILNAPAASLLCREVPGHGPVAYDRQDMDLLKSSREAALALLSEDDQPVGQTLALLLMWAVHTQQALDGETGPWDPAAALDTARDLAADADWAAVTAFFLDLEVLTPRWADRLRHPAPGPWDRRTAALGRYFIRRYWLQAVSDGDLYGRVKFLLTACALIRRLGGDFPATAQLFSKEIENDAQNTDALLDAAYAHPAFTDARVLGMVLL